MGIQFAGGRLVGLSIIGKRAAIHTDWYWDLILAVASSFEFQVAATVVPELARSKVVREDTGWADIAAAGPLCCCTTERFVRSYTGRRSPHLLPMRQQDLWPKSPSLLHCAKCSRCSTFDGLLESCRLALRNTRGLHTGYSNLNQPASTELRAV